MQTGKNIDPVPAPGRRPALAGVPGVIRAPSLF